MAKRALPTTISIRSIAAAPLATVASMSSAAAPVTTSATSARRMAHLHRQRRAGRQLPPPASVANSLAERSFPDEIGRHQQNRRNGHLLHRRLDNFQTITSQSFALSAGTLVMRIYMDKAAANQAVGNFDWFKIIPG